MITPKTLSEKPASQGAVLSVTAYGVNIVVGSWQWIDDRRVFYFECGGEDEFAGHVIEFDEAIAPHDLGVEFSNGGETTAYLTTIEESYIDGAREDWEAWQRVLPDRLSFINSVRADLTRPEED